MTLGLHSLDEVDHAGLSVSHLPVQGQRLQAVIAGERAPRAEVHGAAGLGVAGHRFPPVRPLFELCHRRREEEQIRGGAGRKVGHVCTPLPPRCRQASEGWCHSLHLHVCDGACVFAKRDVFAFACEHCVKALADVYVWAFPAGCGEKGGDSY